jgi:soluble lytic murein transglycosylase-like protein
MAGLIGITAPTSYQHLAARATLVRMTFVIASSIAILVALPGWLRALENAPRFLHVSHPAAATSPTADAGFVNGQPVSAAKREALRQQALADFISKRYRVSTEAVQRFIHLAYSAGQMTKLDPLLILAVMAVESSFNPIAESGMGAKGLMQVIPEYHQDKLRAPHGGELNVLDPETNILVGAKVLREYASRTGGDFMAALGLYSGNGPNPDNPYAVKVFSERERLEQSLRRPLQRSTGQPLPTPSRT